MNSADQPKNDGQPPIPSTIDFHYIKSNYFRVIHADGAWGGVAPGSAIHLCFWSQRPPIPTKMVHAVSSDGTLGDEIKDNRETREGLVREIEADVVMDLPTARELINWLKEKVEQVEKSLGDSSSESKGAE